jgi:succinyl-diaminopimelate desuccinylase
MKNKVLELTMELIRRQSVTPKDEGCLEVIGSRLEACGFQLTSINANNVRNLLAIKGSGEPCFAFAGHTDVVPPGDITDWTSPPFEPTIRNGRLFGRGAADMKGSLAAMVVAVEEFNSKYPDNTGKIAFLLTSDEEGVATDGTIKIVEHIKNETDITIDYCVVGEPSSKDNLGDTIRIGRRGSLNAILRVKGIEGHVAYPTEAKNPIHCALPALDELATYEWDAGNEYYPPTSMQISNLRAGTGTENVIPGTMECQFNFRFSTEHTAESLKQITQQIFDKYSLDYEINWRLSGNPFLTAEGRLTENVKAAIQDRLNIETELSTGGGTSDGRFIAPLGTELIELGPLNNSIHKVNENIVLTEIVELKDLYFSILERMLK